MKIAVATYEDLASFAADPTKNCLVWHHEGSSHPEICQSLEGLLMLYDRWRHHFPMTLVAAPDRLTFDAYDDFDDGFLSEAGGELYERVERDGRVGHIRAGAPFNYPEIFSRYGSWWNPELSAEDMGKAWARLYLAHAAR